MERASQITFFLLLIIHFGVAQNATTSGADEFPVGVIDLLCASAAGLQLAAQRGHLSRGACALYARTLLGFPKVGATTVTIFVCISLVFVRVCWRNGCIDGRPHAHPLPARLIVDTHRWWRVLDIQFTIHKQHSIIG